MRQDSKDSSARNNLIGNLKVRYIGGFPGEKDCPDSGLPEYAFIGRSNVGKSSLINMLCGRHELARTSKNPGKTRLIHLYVVDEQWQIADLPGYGYAKVSKTERSKWQQMIERYMLFRGQLVTAFVLLDLRHSLQDIDRTFINWMGARGVPFSLIYTKSDKLKSREIPRHVNRIEEALLSDWETLPRAFVTSAKKQTGREKILEYISVLNAQLTSES